MLYILTINKIIMASGVALRLSEELVNDAKIESSVYNRSITKQIEYWAKIGKIVLENPDLPVNFIIETLKGLEEVKAKQTKKFNFSAE